MHLEKLRKGVRELVKYIAPVDQCYATTDFSDYILEDQIKKEEFVNEDDGDYIPSPFQNNVYRLEEFIRKNKNHITVTRIRKGETITEVELKALEHILFSQGVNKTP